MQRTDISLVEARKLALVSQRLPSSGFGRGLVGTREAIRELGYIQIDTISVVERAHHHTLWNRVAHYRKRYLDTLIGDRSIFEYWSPAAAYLPMESYRFCLPQMSAIKNGQRRWYDKNPKLMKEVLAKVRAEGALQAKDIESHKKHTGGMWEWGPVKQAIESLFMEGELLITRRDNFQKVFDLAERVIPEGVDTNEPSTTEYAHHLIDSYLKANGIGHATEFSYQRKGIGPAIKKALAEKIEAKDVVPLKVRNIKDIYYAPRDFDKTLNTRLSKSRLKILSPFDNLVIQRKRIHRLFNFDYQLECYVPADKRKHGYFALPLLWDGTLVARMDVKANRRQQSLAIKRLQIEPGLKDIDEFGHRLCSELRKFAQFNQCTDIAIGSKVPRTLKDFMDSMMSKK